MFARWQALRSGIVDFLAWLQSTGRINRPNRLYTQVHFFIGEPGQLGYEVLLGGWENTRVTLSRGHAREPANDARLASEVFFVRGDGLSATRVSVQCLYCSLIQNRSLQTAAFN